QAGLRVDAQAGGQSDGTVGQRIILGIGGDKLQRDGRADIIGPVARIDEDGSVVNGVHRDTDRRHIAVIAAVPGLECKGVRAIVIGRGGISYFVAGYGAEGSVEWASDN